MAKGIRSASEGRVRKNKQTNIGIVSAVYLRDYKLLILFSNNRMKVIDFAAAIAKYAIGDFAIYAKKPHFKKLHIENDNIMWGNNWDLIFPVENVFTGQF